MILAPSILAADWTKLASEIEICEKAGVPWIHFDIMDGNFVPAISFGSSFISQLRTISTLFFDVHLMVANPEKLVDELAELQVNAITFHVEAVNDAHRLIQKIKKLGMQVGIAINPQTSPATLEYLVEFLDIVLVMSVEPGFGGQKFIENTYRKIHALDEMRARQKLGFKISVDGGVNSSIGKKIKEAKGDCLVMGSAFFQEKNKDILIKDFCQ